MYVSNKMSLKPRRPPMKPLPLTKYFQHLPNSFYLPYCIVYFIYSTTFIDWLIYVFIVNNLNTNLYVTYLYI